MGNLDATASVYGLVCSKCNELGLKGSYSELTASEPGLLAAKGPFPGDPWEDGACAGGWSARRAAGSIRVVSVCTHILFH